MVEGKKKSLDQMLGGRRGLVKEEKKKKKKKKKKMEEKVFQTIQDEGNEKKIVKD